MDKVTIELTKDQARWLAWMLELDIKDNASAYMPERLAFVKRLCKKINRQTSLKLRIS